MADEDLRELQRTAADDPGVCSRLAQALRRAGRGEEEVYAALLMGRDAVEVRDALGRHPWSRSATSRRWCPGPGLSSRPRVLWRRELPRAGGPSHQPWSLVASPLGLLVRSGGRSEVLDPRSGERRWALPAGAWAQAWGRRLLLWGRGGEGLEARDAWTGEAEEGAWPPPPLLCAPAEGPCLSGGEGGEVVAWEDGRELWRAVSPASQSQALEACRSGAGWLVRYADEGVTAFDAEGGFRWQFPGSSSRRWTIDEHGLLGLAHSSTPLGVSLFAHHSQGGLAWAGQAERRASVVLTPQVVVIRERSRVVLHDRERGAVRADLALEGGRLRAVAAAGQVVYLLHVEDERSSLLALDHEARGLWRMDLPGAPARSLVPTAGGLLALGEDDSLTALGPES